MMSRAEDGVGAGQYTASDDAGGDGRAGDGDEYARQPLLVARGTGGRLELWDDHVLLIKYGPFNGLVNLFGFGPGRINNSIVINRISSVAIMQPKIFPNFITFTYPGSPYGTGNLMRDAMAENALMMNFFDNRRFFELKALIDRLHRQSHRAGLAGRGERPGTDFDETNE